MAQPKKVKILSPQDAAYIAGVIDGEGTIALVRRQKDHNRCLSLGISNNDRGILNWIRKTIGVGNIITKKLYKEKWFTSFTYQVHGRQAYEVVQQCVPYLRGYKKLRAKLVLKSYLKLTPRNGKYTPKLLARRNKFVEEFFNIETFSIRKFDHNNF